MTLLGNMVKKNEKTLSKIKKVHILIGSKKFKAKLSRADDGLFYAKFTYKHKKKKLFVFRKFTLVDSKAGIVISKKKAPYEKVMAKGDSITLTWKVSIDRN